MTASDGNLSDIGRLRAACLERVDREGQRRSGFEARSPEAAGRIAALRAEIGG